MSGEIKQTAACGACGPAVAVRANCVAEYGPEWEYAGPGVCNECTFDGIIGTRARCRHVARLAPKRECCMQWLTSDALVDPKLTCNPEYSLANCASEIAGYCAEGDRILYNSYCKRWRALRPDDADAVMADYCLRSLHAPECKTWCKNKSAAGSAICDSAAWSWCQVYGKDGSGKVLPFCACLLSPVDDIGVNPKCYDRDCINGGYMTQNMSVTACPNVVTCNMALSLANTGANLVNVIPEQTCGNTSGAPVYTPLAPAAPNATTTGSSVAAPTPGATAGATLDPAFMFVLFLFVIVLLTLIGIGVYALVKKLRDRRRV